MKKILRQHDLDDERFVQIAQRARLKAPEYFPSWNDLNTHDPGVTLLELFAWLTEQQRFHLNQSEDASAFFPLLGITPRHASPAEAEIIIAGGFAPQVIKARTPLYAEDVRFETVEDSYYYGRPLRMQVLQRETAHTPFLLGYADGFHNTRLMVDTKGQIILRDGFSLEIEGDEWNMVNNFNTSRPYDRHYTLNGETGEIGFGDGIRGAMPKGDVIITAMELTFGADGNIAPKRLTQLEGLPISQPDAAKGGSYKETTAQAMARAGESHRWAVTARDIEQLVAETPGLRIERVRAYEGEDTLIAGQPRVINLAVKTREGELTDEAKRKIREHLEPYRLVCRNFRITELQTVCVGLTMELKAGPRGAGFRKELEDSLSRFFSQYYGGFGAKIRPSQIRAFAAAAPGVLEVTYCAFRVYGRARTDAEGNVSLPPEALAELGEVSLRITDTEGYD